MYSIDWARLLSRAPAPTVAPGSPGPAPAAGVLTRSTTGVGQAVWYLGLTSFFTDISSEMVSSILPIYLVVYLHLTPLAFGTIDGLYQGFAASARLVGGFLADRWRNHKVVASVGYALSAACKLAMLAAGGSWSLLAATIALDRTGKGIRTAPRDAIISLTSTRDDLASAFGVHRALDAAGAVLGPLVAFLLFWYLPGAFDLIFLVSFCVAMVGLGVILFFVNMPKRDVRVAEPAVSLAAATGLLGIPAFRRLFVAGAVLSLATVSDSFVFLTLQRQVGFSTTYFPLLYVGVAAFNSLLAVPAGRLADRRGRWGTFVAGHGVLLVIYFLLLAPGAGFGRLVAALGLLGCYYAATDGVLAAMASATLPARLCGSGLALLATGTSTARLLASVLFGALWQWAGLTNAVICFAVGLAAGLVAARLALAPAPDQTDPLGSSGIAGL
jgi:MFS family permease